jgi:hypothetical protein
MNKKMPSVVVLVVLTTITVVCWIGFSVYKALTTKPPVEVPQAVLNPIDPKLNDQYLERLPGRVYLDATGSTTQITLPEDIQEAQQATPQPSTTPLPSLEPEASPTSTPTPSP